MKPDPRIVIPLFVLAGALAAQAGEVRAESSLEQMRNDKLARPVFAAVTWITDFDRARSKAKQEGKLLFAYFTRSYVA